MVKLLFDIKYYYLILSEVLIHINKSLKDPCWAKQVFIHIKIEVQRRNSLSKVKKAVSSQNTVKTKSRSCSAAKLVKITLKLEAQQ